MDLSIEVRQIVRTRPFTNLILAAVRAAVAVGPATVVRLQELLVLPLHVLLEDDAPQLEPAVFVPEPGLFLPVRRVQV